MASQSAEKIDSIRSEGRIAVTALGMACSLGLSHIHACAAARAGLARISELKTLNVAMSAGFGRETVAGPPELKGHSVPEIGLGYAGPAKVLALAAAGLTDLLSTRPLNRDEQRSTRLILNLSDSVIADAAFRKERGGADSIPPEDLPSAAWRRSTAETATRLLRRVGLSLAVENQQVVYGGRVGVVEAIMDAVRMYQQGFAGRVLIGGVESCVEPAFLFAADSMNVLRTNQNPVGFIPGEAAAFFLLERADADRSGKKLPQLESAVTAADPADMFSDDAPLGQGLSLAVEQAIQEAGEPPDFILGDLNGLERRAIDWGHALVRSAQRQSLGSLPLWLPALSFGEIGAATTAAAVNLAVRAWQRGYAPGVRGLVWTASDDRRRGAVMLHFTA